MIDSISTSGIPTQQRTAINEGVRIKEIKEDEKPASTNQFEKKQSQEVNQKKKEKVKEIVKGLNDFLQPAHTSIKFKLHEKLNEYYVTIVDDITNEVVKEIPAKKLLDTYADMAEHLGLLVDKKI
ncbi:flagellar protein FlaG [Neobacillus sp. PS3-40]|uniref:flagellar protein FlaG n=1 Tax=Neobacillus sp. PS3-40 TaxID=3070679 RepID=UPI0027DF44D5|nr:flagellar protein FlaG [Neobacillus sp. PS3-40]WML46069.1 flagellar protein FlaG [Neobacillus sp. PS3-40]